jgi:uncharacterized protein (TIGR04222 family)
LLLGGFALLWLARGRDAKALATDAGPVDVLLRDGDRVSFASPDGVLPGQIGTVVDERVDPADLAATVVDLAVRNYLWVLEVDGDWQLVRRNPADDALTDYERVVLATLLPQGAEQVALSGLRPQLGPVRAAMYADVVARNWFTHRPDQERSRWAMIGAGLVVFGIAATVVLALTAGHALLGLAFVIGGIGLIVGARWMPARTRRGSLLLQQIRGLLSYLRTTEAASIPDADRELVFSRSLPYAVALGDTEHWLRTFGGASLYWYEGAPENVTKFLATLTKALQ